MCVEVDDSEPRRFVMAESRTVVYVSSESELAQALRNAAATGEPVTVDTDDAQYDVDVHVRWDADPKRSTGRASQPDEHEDEPDPLLGIIGIFASGDPDNDVAQDKHRYLTDAYLSERA